MITYTVVMIDFDGLENRTPLVKRDVFSISCRIDDFNAVRPSIDKFFRDKPVVPYCGYNREIYPKFEIVRRESVYILDE
jgi:hypothetical protein